MRGIAVGIDYTQPSTARHLTFLHFDFQDRANEPVR